jgi:hypothetical protein
MHFGQGALVGVVRSLMAQVGLRGPVASAMFTVLRLTKDQILENATGVGAPPQTWPSQELAVDLLQRRSTGSPREPWPTRSPVGTDSYRSAARGHASRSAGRCRPLPRGVDRRSLTAHSACTPPVSRAADVSARTRPRVAVRRVRCAACGPLRARVDPRPRLLVAPAAGGGVAAPTHHGHAVGVAARRRLHVEPVDVREAPQPGPLHRETAQRLVGPG